MKLRFALFVTLMVCLACDVSAQTFEVPQNYAFRQKSDYAQYNADVLKAIDWMVQTPSSDQSAKRQQVATFLLAWMAGTPDVSMQISDAVTNLADKNPDMLLINMGGYTKYVLENPADKDKFKAAKAAIKMVLAKYQNDKTSVKDKELDKLVKLNKQGTLDNWIAKSFG